MTGPLSGRVVALTLAACAATAVLDGGVSSYGTVALGLIVAKVAAAWLFAPRSPEHPTRPASRVVVVVPGFNEDPALWSRCLRSIAAQSMPAAAVIVVDDGSTEADLAALTDRHRPVFAAAGVDLAVHRFPENRGKREALGYGFRAAADTYRPDIFVTVDSDTVLDVDCVAQLAAAFTDRRVTAATAMVGAANRRGLLARMVDVRYTSAFAVDRGWQSVFGAMLCCCGSAAAYRADMIARRVDEFTSQQFLGRRCTYGDDRRLTALALRDGRTVVAAGAKATTAVPERWSHWVRQQVRWNRSWIRETTLLLVEQPAGRPAFWFGLFEASSWVSFSVMLAVSVASVAFGQPRLGVVVAAVMLVTVARSAAYVDRVDMPARSRLAGLAVAPLYGLVHVVLVAVVIRLWALFTLREPGWGTRERIEVTA